MSKPITVVLVSCGLANNIRTNGSRQPASVRQRAADAPIVNYGMIASILKKHLDKSESVNPVQVTPPHEQIRGPQTYL